MKLKQYPPTPKLGDTKTIIKFAWWPTRVEDSLIWLERYEATYEWNEYAVGYEHSSESYWDLKSTKLIVNKPGLPDFKNTTPAPLKEGAMKSEVKGNTGPTQVPPPKHVQKIMKDYLKQDPQIKEFAQRFRTFQK